METKLFHCFEEKMRGKSKPVIKNVLLCQCVCHTQVIGTVVRQELRAHITTMPVTLKMWHKSRHEIMILLYDLVTHVHHVRLHCKFKPQYTRVSMITDYGLQCKLLPCHMIYWQCHSTPGPSLALKCFELLRYHIIIKQLSCLPQTEKCSFIIGKGNIVDKFLSGEPNF